MKMAEDRSKSPKNSPIGEKNGRRASPGKQKIGPTQHFDETLSDGTDVEEEQLNSHVLSADDNDGESLLESLNSESRAATDVVNLCMNKVLFINILNQYP